MKKTILVPLALVAIAAALGIVTRAAADDGARTIAVTARRFEFEPKVITLKAGETVRLAVTSQDVRHGFFSRPLGIDADLTPGETSMVTVTPRQAGSYTVICDHFCGAQHGNMKMTVTVE